MSEWKRPWWRRLVHRQPPVVAEDQGRKKPLYQIDLSGSSPKWRKMFLKALAEEERKAQEKREAREKKV